MVQLTTRVVPETMVIVVLADEKEEEEKDPGGSRGSASTLGLDRRKGSVYRGRARLVLPSEIDLGVRSPLAGDSTLTHAPEYLHDV